MNVYLVDAGEVTDYHWDEPPETFRLVELVAAHSRAKAQYIVWQANRRDLDDLHEVNWHTRLVARDAQRGQGILGSNDNYWELTCDEHWGRPCVCAVLVAPPQVCEECGEGGAAYVELSTVTGQTGRTLCPFHLLSPAERLGA